MNPGLVVAAVCIEGDDRAIAVDTLDDKDMMTSDCYHAGSRYRMGKPEPVSC